MCCDNIRSIINTEKLSKGACPHGTQTRQHRPKDHRNASKKCPHPGKRNRKRSLPLLPPVSARIEHLEKNGLITGYHAQINPVFLGYHIKAFINLEVEPYQKKDFYPFIQSIPNVIECNCVTGDYAMLIEVAFRSTMELDHFINELQQFGRTKTQIVFSTSVEHRDLPVE